MRETFKNISRILATDLTYLIVDDIADVVLVVLCEEEVEVSFLRNQVQVSSQLKLQVPTKYTEWDLNMENQGLK